MAHEFALPDIGEGLTEATVVSWYVEVGQIVGLDEPLVEIETDKAVVDIPSPFAGTVLHHGAKADETIAVGSLLAVVGLPDEDWTPQEDAPGAGTGRTSAESAPLVGSLAGPEDRPSVPQALPAVRKLAAELGVDLSAVTATGPVGRITKADVRAAADDRPSRRVPMTRLRKTISDNMTRSWREIPHVTTFGTADATALLALREELGKPPLEALLIYRITPVLAAEPMFNAVIDGDVIVERGYRDIGIAVDTPDGLVVAVIRDADRLSITELADEVRRLAAGARDRSLSAAEMRGQTFTISNIGAVGGGFGTPIIPTGTAAILSIGRADPRPVVRGDTVVVGREFPLSLSYDHRLIDGATGRRFMSLVVGALEQA